MSYEELRRELVISPEEDESAMVMEMVEKYRKERALSMQRPGQRPGQRQYVVPEAELVGEESEGEEGVEQVEDEPEQIAEYAEAEFELGGEGESTELYYPESPGYEETGTERRTRAASPGTADGSDVMDFASLSKNEKFLPLMYIRPLNEQNLILQNAVKSEFRVVHDLDKVTDRVLSIYVERMADGPIRDLFVRYAEQRGLKI